MPTVSLFVVNKVDTEDVLLVIILNLFRLLDIYSEIYISPLVF